MGDPKPKHLPAVTLDAARDVISSLEDKGYARADMIAILAVSVAAIDYADPATRRTAAVVFA